MNMKTMIAVFAVAATTVASAHIFNWTVEEGDGYTGYANLQLQGWGNKTGDGKWWGTATATTDKTNNQYVDNVFKFENGKLWTMAQGDVKEWKETGSLIFRLSGYSYNDNNYIKSNAASWDDIYAALTGKDKACNFTIAKITLTSDVIPEPTSGLMLLLGAGMLALRRKQVRV